MKRAAEEREFLETLRAYLFDNHQHAETDIDGVKEGEPYVPSFAL